MTTELSNEQSQKFKRGIILRKLFILVNKKGEVNLPKRLRFDYIYALNKEAGRMIKWDLSKFCIEDGLIKGIYTNTFNDERFTIDVDGAPLVQLEKWIKELSLDYINAEDISREEYIYYITEILNMYLGKNISILSILNIQSILENQEDFLSTYNEKEEGQWILNKLYIDENDKINALYTSRDLENKEQYLVEVENASLEQLKKWFLFSLEIPIKIIESKDEKNETKS